MKLYAEAMQFGQVMRTLASILLKIKTVFVPKLQFCLVATETSHSYQNVQFRHTFMKFWIQPKLHAAMLYLRRIVLKLGYWVILW